nr:nucleotidyltransferase family protein [uncultured Ruminococcus sp.]
MVDRQEERDTAYRILSLLRWSLCKNDFPNADYSEDYCDRLFTFAKAHGVVSLVAYALERNGVKSSVFHVESAKIMSYDVLYDHEYKNVTGYLDEAGICYLPLKGIELKHLYPLTYLREMSDIDLLLEDDASADAAKAVMNSAGYITKSFRKSNHDVYCKKPMFSFEIHRTLVDEHLFPDIGKAVEGLWTRLSKEDGCKCRMKASESDRYLLIILHAYKHYITGGMGLRVLLDVYLFTQAYGDKLDRDMINARLKTAGAAEYEQRLLDLSQRFLSPESLSEEQRGFLDEFIFYGLYGSRKRAQEMYFKKYVGEGTEKNKLLYIRQRLTVPEARIERSRFFSKHRRLAPILAVYRPVKSVVTRPRKLIKELKELKKYR